MSARTHGFALALLAALTLAGCATGPGGPSLPDDQAMIATNVHFVIPSPGALGRSVTVAQTIVIHVRGQSFSFDGQLQVTPDQLDLVALDGMGRRALTVDWKAGKITSTQAPWLPAFVRPANILADITTMYWPQKALDAALANSGAALTVTAMGRTLSAGGHDLVVVSYGAGQEWNRTATLRNLVFGYELDIRSSEIAQ